jgi:hypothetical protein
MGAWTDRPWPAAIPVLDSILELERRAFGAATPSALGFIIVNETSMLAPYRQAALFTFRGSTNAMSLTHASGQVSVSGDTPYAVWLTQLAGNIAQQPAVQAIDIETAPAHLSEGWREWLPERLIACNIYDRNAERIGLALYGREKPWQEDESAFFRRIHETYGYCQSALLAASKPLAARAAELLQPRWLKRIAIVAAAALLIPMRLSAVAPAEVVALSAVAISAPQDGVVGTFHVHPSSSVKKGDKLFSLDDRDLKARRAVALQSLQVARADLLSAQQRAFDDSKSKGELAATQGRVKEKEAEMQMLDGLLERITVRAPRDGIIIFGDANDWLGRPVQTGERIMQLADPRDAGVLVWLPVADAINLDVGAPIRLFLHTQPLSPLSASLVETSYQSVQSPTNVSSYRIRGRFDRETADARIGLRGTARVSGSWTCLGYYLLRRPIAAVREWTGL